MGKKVSYMDRNPVNLCDFDAENIPYYIGEVVMVLMRKTTSPEWVTVY